MIFSCYIKESRTLKRSNGNCVLESWALINETRALDGPTSQYIQSWEIMRRGKNMRSPKFLSSWCHQEWEKRIVRKWKSKEMKYLTISFIEYFIFHHIFNSFAKELYLYFDCINFLCKRKKTHLLKNYPYRINRLWIYDNNITIYNHIFKSVYKRFIHISCI